MKRIYIEDIMKLPWDENVKVLFEIKKEDYWNDHGEQKLAWHTEVVNKSPSKIGIYKGAGPYGLLQFVFPDVPGTSIYEDGEVICLDNPGSYCYDANEFAWIDGYTDHNEHYNFFLVDE